LERVLEAEMWGESTPEELSMEEFMQEEEV